MKQKNNNIDYEIINLANEIYIYDDEKILVAEYRIIEIDN